MSNSEFIEKEAAIAKYTAAVCIHSTECEIIWSRYNAMLVLNTLLISAIGLTYSNDNNIPVVLNFLFIVLGLISCFVWYATAYRGFKWIDYWISKANLLEEKYLKDVNVDLNPIIEGKAERNRIGFPKTPNLSLFLVLCVGVIYLVIFILQLNSLIPITGKKYIIKNQWMKKNVISGNSYHIFQDNYKD